jgi:hypothetical protein
MKFSELRKQLQEKGELEAAKSVTSASSLGNSPTSKTPFADSKMEARESEVENPKHCRSCSHLRLHKIPEALESGGRAFNLAVVTAKGTHKDVPIEKIAGKLIATCALENWGKDYVAAPHQVIQPSTYFEQHGSMCADFEMKDGQISELLDAIALEPEA